MRLHPYYYYQCHYYYHYYCYHYHGDGGDDFEARGCGNVLVGGDETPYADAGTILWALTMIHIQFNE